MVSSTHWLASTAAMRILERGGNAFDAVVAGGLTLQVVEPHLNGLGGDLPIIFTRAEEDSPRVICGQGVAPAAASIERFQELDLDLIPGTGLLCACVPGAFDAWMTLLRDHGTCEIEEVFEMAIAYADHGTPVSAQLAEILAGVSGLFEAHWPSSAELYLGDGPPSQGTLVRNRPLADTYRRIVREAKTARGREAQIDAARACFYQGFVASAIDSFLASAVVRDSSGRDNPGLLSGEDLASWQASYEEPVCLSFGGYEIYKTGPWGQGPVLLQQLALLDGFDLAEMGHNSAEYIHAVVETGKLAFADREAWYGDPNFVDVPLETLLSAGYASERRRLVGERASAELRPGGPDGREPRLAQATSGSASGLGIGEPTVGAIGDTCHIDVVDRHGNIVSATPSGGWLQSSPAIPGLGFSLGTRAQMFWLEPGLPNSLAPRKRPRTTLTPTLALKDGGARIGFGSPGGDQQDQWAMNFLLGVQAFGLGLQQAIDAPQFQSLNAPSSFYPRRRVPGRLEVEGRLAPDIVADLRDRGHDVVAGGDWAYGRVCAVARGEDRLLRGAASPRAEGYAIGR